MPGNVNRRDWFRSAVIGGAAVLAPVAEGQKAMPGQTADSREHPNWTAPDLAAADWKPVFLDAHQDATLAMLADAMIPETDTPGAKAALVDRFIDLLLAAETPERQKAFVQSLSYIDGESFSRYGAAFVDLKPESRRELLELFAYPMGESGWTGERIGGGDGHSHFEHLKGWITEAFYTSEVGMKSLGWDGQVIHGPMMGCPTKPGQGA